MSTEFKGVRHYDEHQLAWEIEVCPFDWAVDYEQDMDKVWKCYKDAQKTLGDYIKELVELRSSLACRMAKRVGDEDIAVMYG